MFKHYILTRWNLGLYTDNPYKVQNPDGWMDRRIALFEKYCLPNILNQTCKNFTWVMSFDDRTPVRYLIKYDYLDCVQIIYEQPHVWLRQQQPECEWLITTRLDNDDQLDERAVELLHRSFRESEEVIDLEYEVIDIKTGNVYPSMRRRANSPFLSLVEPWRRNPVTAMGRPHSKMVEFYPARKLDNILASQIIHGGNLMNKIPQ